MKKLIYGALGIMLIFQTSCNKDDKDDPIIGHWSLYEIYQEDEEISNECDRQSTLIFSDKGKLGGKYFEEDNEGIGNCESGDIDGKWDKKGNNKYSVTYFYEGKSEELEGTLSGYELTFDYTIKDGDDEIKIKTIFRK